MYKLRSVISTAIVLGLSTICLGVNNFAEAQMSGQSFNDKSIKRVDVGTSGCQFLNIPFGWHCIETGSESVIFSPDEVKGMVGLMIRDRKIDQQMFEVNFDVHDVR